MADRVHTWVASTQSPCCEPALNRTPADTEIQQLPSPDDSMLSQSQAGYRFVIAPINFTNVNLPTY